MRRRRRCWGTRRSTYCWGRRPLPLLRQDRPPALLRPAVTGEAPLRGRRVPLLEHVGVIVRELLAGDDVANALDPDAPVVDHRVAVGIARVIDEARLVPVHRGVDHHVVVDGEEEGVVPLARQLGVARVGFGRGESLARVLDEAHPRRDVAGGEGAEPLHWRGADGEGEVGGAGRSAARRSAARRSVIGGRHAGKIRDPLPRGDESR